MVAGGVAATELGMLPDVYNKRYAPEDSQDFRTAEKNLSDPISMFSAYAPMAALSSLGAGTGAKIFGGKDKGPALAARSEPAISRLGTGDRAQRSQNFTKSIEDDAILRAAAQPPAPPAAPIPPNPPTQPRVKVPQADKRKGLELALRQMASGKKINLSRLKALPAKKRAELEQLVRDHKAANPNVPPDVLADVIRGQADRGQLKYGVAGAATGYSAILAERLAKMEEDKAQEY
jgi:hypothetical protein